MGDNYFERFIQWQNYVHYILLTLGVSGIVYYFKLYGLIWWKMLIILAIIIFAVDSIIHGIFWVLPEPLQWRD